MEETDLIDQRVHNYYWEEDLNCAITMLKILGEIFAVEIEKQVIDSAVGLHGAGKFGAQCGLVEGALMFIGILGKQQEISEAEIVDYCYNFADQFEAELGSLLCRELRPEGFKPENPPHLCEDMSKQAVKFAVSYIKENGIGS